MAQIFKLMIWKILVLRRRRWFVSSLEVIIPIIMFWLLVYFKNLMPDSEETIIYDTMPIKYDQMALVFNVNKANIAYTPSNNVTDTIMAYVFSVLNASTLNGTAIVTMVHNSTEDGVVSWLKEQYIKESANSSNAYDDNYTPGFGVIFKNADSNGSLEYTIRTTYGDLDTSSDTLYGEQLTGFYKYYSSGFATIQALIDQAFLTNYHQVNVSDSIYTSDLPYTKFSVTDILSLLLSFYVTVGFTSALPSLLRCVVEEKSSGIKEMTRIMGLKIWINWITWVMFTMMLFIPTSIVITYFLTEGSSPAVAANPVLIWLVLNLFMITFITLIFAMSTFFTNGVLAVIVGQIVWYVVSIVIDSLITNYPDKFGLWVHIVTCLWPSIALMWVLNTINNFQRNGDTWTLTDFWDDGAGGGRVSVGLAVIMLLVDIVVYSIITWYIDSVNPGPYGKRKPFTFIFKCFSRGHYDSSTTYRNGIYENYESTPGNSRVGIRIENLRKTFNRGKVVAVDNVDIDIYEGNITALLGHNGAGKTTTMSMLTGFFSPTRGKIIVKGKNIFDDMDDFRSSLGLCPQHNLVFSYFTVLDHLVFFGMLKGLSWKQAEEEGIKLLKPLRMDVKKDEMVSKLSGGMKRKLCLCISLMGNPEVLVLDEPTSGLDPESRRHVWDLLLSFRGQRTTIISTHFMEEADVLGDRIAIMDHGRVSCYGTSMFLKKLYGTGYHLNIAKHEAAPIAPITSVVEQHTKDATMKVISDAQITYNIKSGQSAQFPAMFAALERLTQRLGLKGVSITCTTMEDVFLKVAEEPKEKMKSVPEMNRHTDRFVNKYNKVSGVRLLIHQFEALLYKRLLDRMRTWFTTLVYFVLPIVLTWYAVNRSMAQDYSLIQPDLVITLSNFADAHVAVKSDNVSYTKVLHNLIDNQAVYETVPNDTDFYPYMAEWIDESLISYEREIIAGFSVNSSMFLGSPSVYFIHSPALVLNMVANTLLQLVSPSSNITVHNHPLAVRDKLDICELSALSASQVYYFPMVLTYISLAFIVQGMSFISFPLKERVTNARQLQLMTGVSPVLYWSTTFLCDFALYLLMAVIEVGVFCIFQENGIYTASGYLGTLFAVLVLYGLSGIAFSYFFSFLVGSSIKACVIFIMLNMLLGTVGSVLLAVFESLYNYYGVYRFILSFNPVFSGSYAIYRLLAAMYIDGTCLQCAKDNCATTYQDPLQFMDSGPNAVHLYGIKNFMVFMAADAVLYFALVLLIEYGVFKRLWFSVSKLWIKLVYEVLDDDEDVQIEKEKVNSSQSLKGFYSSLAILCVKDLAKKYNRKSTAVQGVSFQVGRGECFGLLGVNGAGKTTTFKMLTGEEIPNRGDAMVQQMSLTRRRSQFLAQIGYCPQFDAINKLLTGREMLYVYALLRGIPHTHCNSEITRWIQIMGLTEYADRRCGTYSGGNKRKLSTAMAFIGEPPVVFLDEPTSGVDPVSRRRLWEVMSKCQQAGQAIVLTSHSMEECEALCSRLTIMVGGQMKCVGSAPYLKQKFGQGYTIKIKLQTTQTHVEQLQRTTSKVKRQIEAFFHNAIVKDEHVGLVHYHIPDPSIPLSRLFSVMEGLKQTHPVVEDYNVSDTSLEEVFMSFARRNATS